MRKVVMKKPGRRVTARTGDADQRIYEAIFLAVRSQRLRPGTKLTEASLCELFDVSRTIVRKALQRLAHENIVELRPNRGASIASPSRAETAEVFAARRAIEAAILPLAVVNASKTQLTRLSQHVKKEQQALDAGDHPTWIHLTGEFHLVLAEIAGNRVLASFLSELVSRCSLIIALYDTPASSPCSKEEHEQLIDMIAAKNSVGALRLMERHLLSIERKLRVDDGRDQVDLADILKVA
jgi:DNA-binding GntR family transcriptional regulator